MVFLLGGGATAQALLLDSSEQSCPAEAFSQVMVTGQRMYIDYPHLIMPDLHFNTFSTGHQRQRGVPLEPRVPCAAAAAPASTVRGEAANYGRARCTELSCL